MFAKVIICLLRTTSSKIELIVDRIISLMILHLKALTIANTSNVLTKFCPIKIFRHFFFFKAPTKIDIIDKLDLEI